MRVPVIAALAVLTACAKSPESIAPAYVSDIPYQSWTCQQLGEEQSRLSSALAIASKQQEDARTNDTVGVIFLGLPVSTLSGDNVAPEIARLKGTIAAVQTAATRNNCGGAALATPSAVSTPLPVAPLATDADGVYNVTATSLKIRAHSDDAKGDVTAQAAAICRSHGKKALKSMTKCLSADCGQRDYLFICQ